jgi:hypothetical protein
MRGRRVGEGGYDGEESYGRGMIIFLGGRIMGGEKTVCLAGLFFWCWEFGFGVFGESEVGGTGFTGGFGHGGKDILTISWS